MCGYLELASPGEVLYLKPTRFIYTARGEACRIEARNEEAAYLRGQGHGGSISVRLCPTFGRSASVR